VIGIINKRTRGTHNVGLTLLEVMIAIAILAMLSTIIYGAFDGLAKTKQGLSHKNERYHEARAAMRRLATEVSSAFLSAHVPLNPNLIAARTIFASKDSSPVDRLDMTTFSHRRVTANSRESDQNELSYFGSVDPKKPNKTDLARREQAIIDYEPQRGGVVQVLVEDIELFDLKFLDPLSGLWINSWDSSQGIGQPNRLPMMVRMTLSLKASGKVAAFRLTQKVPIAMTTPLNFGIPK